MRFNDKSSRAMLAPSVAKLARKSRVDTTGLYSQASTKATYAAIPRTQIPRVVRYSFLLYVSSLPVGVIDLGFMPIGFSPPKLSGLLFFACYFFYHNPLSRRSFPPVPGVMWWFLGYMAVYMLNGLFISAEFAMAFILSVITLAQLVVFFWIASNLLKDGKLARQALLTYAIACSVFAIASIFRVPGLSVEDFSGRQTALGEDMNALALLMALAVLINIGSHLNDTVHREFISKIMRKILLVILTLPPLVIMVNTGSRSGVVAFMFGASVYLLPYYRSKRTLTAIFLGLLTIIGMLYMVTNNPDFLERWQELYHEHNLAGRENIIPTAVGMILEQPIFGWQPVKSSYELGLRLGIWKTVAAHNLFLGLLLDVGVLGTIPFLIGLWLCGRAAWRARVGNLGLLPVALLVTALVGNMAIPALSWKPFWLVMALSLAAASVVEKKRAKTFPMFMLGRRNATGIRRSVQT